jgi:hypothetical protein
MPAQTKLAQLIARMEGFGVPGAKPTRDHNPGDLEHAPGITAWDGAIGIEPSDEQGWADLERQLKLYAERGLTLRQMVNIYAPPDETPGDPVSVVENDTPRYLDFICHNIGLDPDSGVRAALSIPAEAA